MKAGDGQGSLAVLQSTGLQRVRHDRETELKKLLFLFPYLFSYFLSITEVWLMAFYNVYRVT